MPSFIGAMRPIIAFVATAASIALPPLSRMRAPTSDASTLSLATIPLVDATIDRDCDRSWALRSLREKSSEAAATAIWLERFIDRVSDGDGGVGAFAGIYRRNARWRTTVSLNGSG